MIVYTSIGHDPLIAVVLKPKDRACIRLRMAGSSIEIEDTSARVEQLILAIRDSALGMFPVGPSTEC